MPILLGLAVLVLAYRLRIWSRLPAYVAQNIEASGGLVPLWLRQWDQWFQLLPVERAFAAVGWTLRLLGRPQPLNATPAAQAAALSKLMPTAAKHVDILRSELETGLFTSHAADQSRARKASLMVLLHGLQARLDMSVAALDGRAVYSGTDFPHQPRGTR